MVDRYLKEVFSLNENADYKEQFNISKDEKGNVIITQLFGYYTKYPIYVETNDKQKSVLKKMEKYDVDVYDLKIEEDGGKTSLSLYIRFQSKTDNNEVEFVVMLKDGKETIKE